ncbi:MAG: YitT family protein, partial [Oscillospiraceae bacterium]|nr:YitT family protein [Oscillospiraceae bacterium]
MERKDIKREVLHYAVLLAGSVIAAFALEKILVPATIMDGGMVGVAMIVSRLTHLPLGILTILFNLP